VPEAKQSKPKGGYTMNYSEKLKDPRWQKKRLEVFERDEWSCQRCGDGENTLTVHHLSYSAGKEPWDYPLDNFMTLCQSCHDYEYTNRPTYENMILHMLRQKGFMADDLFYLVAAFQKLSIKYPSEVMGSIVEYIFKDEVMANIYPWFWADCKKRAEMMREAIDGQT
jgi:hypothetical protein